MSLATGVAALATRIAEEFNSVRTALAGKAADSAVVHNTGTETVGGAKTFSTAPNVPVGSLLTHAVRRDDARLTDARTPTAHASSHGVGQADDISAAYVPWVNVGGPGGVAAYNDARLSDARTPTAHKASHATGGGDALAPSDIGASATGHTHAGADIASGTVGYARLPVGTAASTVAAGDDSRFTSAVAFSRLPVGSSSSTVAVGNDARLSDARTPTAHASSHMPGGADEIDHVISTKTANYTLTDADEVVVFDSTSGARTATLPAASGRAGKVFTIKKLAGGIANPVTIDPNASELIDGQTTEIISMSGGFRQIICDGTKWHIIGGKVEPVILTLSNVANGGTITCDASAASIYRVTTTGAGATVAVPTQGIDGDAINIEVTPSATLSLAINASILLTTGITTPIAAASGKKVFLGLRCIGSTWYLQAATVQS